MFSEDTLDRIRKSERFIYGGLVERVGGRLVYSSDGSPVPMSREDPLKDFNDRVKIAKAIEQLFLIFLPEDTTFHEEKGYYTIPVPDYTK